MSSGDFIYHVIYLNAKQLSVINYAYSGDVS